MKAPCQFPDPVTPRVALAPGGAYGVAVRPDGTWLYVASPSDGGTSDGALLLLETASQRMMASVAVGA